MKALILNGERSNESMLSAAEDVVRQELSSARWKADAILLREKKIAPCKGCFDCWIKSPGICSINDFGRDIARMAANSELIIFLTPITFGGYSSELKKAVDRFSCSLLLPFFMKVNGEVHHKPRYDPLPDLIGIGVPTGRDDESEGIFGTLVQRNAINLHCRLSQSVVFQQCQDRESMAKEIRALLGNLKERK